MKTALGLLPLLPALASASITLGFEDIDPGYISVQPYGDYITLSGNYSFNVIDFARAAPEGARFIHASPGGTYDVAAVSGFSLLGVSVGGIDGLDSMSDLWPTGTFIATISLYGGASGTTFLSTVNVGIPAAPNKYTVYVFSDFTPSEVTRFVLADSLTPDIAGFFVDAIVVSGGGAIPEPSTYGLSLGGLALAFTAYRRRSKQA